MRTGWVMPRITHAVDTSKRRNPHGYIHDAVSLATVNIQTHTTAPATPKSCTTRGSGRPARWARKIATSAPMSSPWARVSVP